MKKKLYVIDDEGVSDWKRQQRRQKQRQQFSRFHLQAIFDVTSLRTLSARACQLDPRIKACISQEGEVNPVGSFFDYPDHTALRRPFLLIEVDWHPTDDLLARMRESRTQWDEYLAHKHLQLESCAAGSYYVVLSVGGMTHASFSDGLLLSAAPGSAQASTALSNLLLTETIDRSFLDKHLKNEPAPLFDQAEGIPSGVTVERIGR